MTAPLDRVKLAKLLGLLGSEHDGEILSAAHQVERLRREARLTWAEILAAEPVSGGFQIFRWNPAEAEEAIRKARSAAEERRRREADIFEEIRKKREEEREKALRREAEKAAKRKAAEQARQEKVKADAEKQKQRETRTRTRWAKIKTRPPRPVDHAEAMAFLWKWRLLLSPAERFAIHRLHQYSVDRHRPADIAYVAALVDRLFGEGRGAA